MTTDGNRPIEACLIDLFRHLGIERAHIAAGEGPDIGKLEQIRAVQKTPT
jgi:hypothetical protein